MNNNFKPDDFLQSVIHDVMNGNFITLYELAEEYSYKALKPFDPVVVTPMGESSDSKKITGTVLRIDNKYGFEKIFVMADSPEYNTEFDEVEGRPYFTIVSR